jgi:uncharacterized protein (TIGR02145 family)
MAGISFAVALILSCLPFYESEPCQENLSCDCNSDSACSKTEYYSNLYSSSGKSSNSELTLTECPVYNSETHFCDSRDFKVYRFTEIGNQIWMAENLNYNASGSVCNSCNIYGRLYNWASAMAACPENWYLPSAEEWTILTNYISENDATSIGLQLKATSSWRNFGNGTDDYGFSALAAGYGYHNGAGNIGRYAIWWGSTEIDNYLAWRIGLDYDNSGLSAFNENGKEAYQLSVRCIKELN